MPGTMDGENPASPSKIEDSTSINGVNGRSEAGTAEVGGHGDGLKVKDNLEEFEIVRRDEDNKENANGPNGTLQNGAENSMDSSESVPQDEGEDEMEHEDGDVDGSPEEDDEQSEEKPGEDVLETSEDMQQDTENREASNEQPSDGAPQEMEVHSPDQPKIDSPKQSKDGNESMDQNTTKDTTKIHEDEEKDDKNESEKNESLESKKESEPPENGVDEADKAKSWDNELKDSVSEKTGQSKADNTKVDSKQKGGTSDGLSKDESVVVIDSTSPQASPTKVIVVKNVQKEEKKKPSKVDRMLAGAKGSGGTDKTGGENMRPFAKLLFDLGLDLCRQQVYKDLIKVQKKKDSHNKLSDGEKNQLDKLKDAYDHLVDKNEPFLRDTTKCKICSFKSDLTNPLELHKEYEHSGVCAICGHVSQNTYSYYFHMEAEHNRQGRVQPVMGMHTCPYCPYEHHSSRKNFLKHLTKCESHFKLNRNLQPVPSDCDIPLKAPPLPTPSKTTPRAPVPQKKPEPRPSIRPAPTPTTGASQVVVPPNMLQGNAGVSTPWSGHQDQTGPQLVQIGNQYFLVVQQNGQTFMTPMVTGAQSQQTVSIPQKPTTKPSTTKVAQVSPNVTVKDANSTAPGQYEICEICGGFVKDRESLRIHFFHAHKIEIHPSVMKEKKPSLKCQHCAKSFWTYQGYKRHCLVSHPSMKDFAQLMTCYVCTEQVPDFITHMTSKHPQVVRHMLSQIRCVVCQAAFPSETALESHMLMDHKDIVTKYGSMTGSDKQSASSKNSQPSPSKQNPTPVGLYSNSSNNTKVVSNSANLKTCSRCDFKYTTTQSYKAHFNRSHTDDVEPCLLCEDLVKVGKPHIEHVQSKHLKLTKVTMKKLTDDDIANFGRSRKRKRSTEEVIVIDLDSKKKKSQPVEEDMQVIEVDQAEKSQKDDDSEMEVIDADDIVDLDKSDVSSQSDDKKQRGAVTEEIIEVDGEQIVVQKLDE